MMTLLNNNPLLPWLVSSILLLLLSATTLLAFAPMVVPRHQHHHRTTATTPTTTELYLFRLRDRLRRNNNKRQSSNDTIHHALINRRTVSQFEPTPRVPEDIVRRAIDAAIHAPCHKMTEPWRFILLGEQSINEIATLNAAAISKVDPEKGLKKKQRWAQIPGWVVVTCTKSSNDKLQEREDYAATCCAVQNFQLSLYSSGVGTKWTTGPITRTPEFAQVCGIDLDKEDVVGCMWYGYASGGLESIRTPKRKRSVDDVLHRRP